VAEIIRKETTFEPECLNCGRPASLRYCPYCGQSTREPRASVSALLTEAFGTIFNVDSRVIRSLRPLFLQPGVLTLNFMKGRRMSFVPPVRLYLVCSLIFFLSLNYISTQAALHSDTNDPIVFDNDDVELLKKNKGTEPLDSETTPETLETIEDPPSAANPPVPDPPATEPLDWKGRLEKQFEASAKRFNNKPTAEVLPILIPPLFRAISNGLVLLMPLFALFLKMLYVRRDPYYLDHLIFALHFHSFLFIFFSSLLWWNHLIDADLSLITALSICVFAPIYLYKGMRRVFQQGRIKTIGKFVVLCGLYGFSMLLLIVLSLAYAFLTA